MTRTFLWLTLALVICGIISPLPAHAFSLRPIAAVLGNTAVSIQSPFLKLWDSVLCYIEPDRPTCGAVAVPYSIRQQPVAVSAPPSAPTRPVSTPPFTIIQTSSTPQHPIAPPPNLTVQDVLSLIEASKPAPSMSYVTGGSIGTIQGPDLTPIYRSLDVLMNREVVSENTTSTFADALTVQSGATSTFLGALAASAFVGDGSRLTGLASFSTSSVRGVFAATLPLAYDASSGQLGIAQGYALPSVASTTDWNEFFTSPASRIVAGTNLTWNGTTLDMTGLTPDPWESQGADLYYTAGRVGVGTSTPAATLAVAGDGLVTGDLTTEGALQANTLVVSGTDAAGLAAPTGLDGHIDYDRDSGHGGNYYNSSPGPGLSAGYNRYAIEVYAYRTVGSDKMFSKGSAIADVTHDMQGDSAFAIHWMWDPVAGADGYRVVYDANGTQGFYGDHYYDTPDAFLDDDGCGTICFSAGSPGVGNAMTVHGATSLSGSLDVESNSTFGGAISVTGPLRTSGGSIFGGRSLFAGISVFNSNSTFNGPSTFRGDTTIVDADTGLPVFTKSGSFNNGNTSFTFGDTSCSFTCVPALMIDESSNRVGINTSSPAYPLDVGGAINASAYFLDGTPLVPSQWTNNGSNISFSTGQVGVGTSSPSATLAVKGAGVGLGVNFTTTNSADQRLFTILDNGKVGIGTTTPTLGPLVMASGAYVTAGGTWTNASDRNLKENFTPLDPQDVLQKIDQLSIAQWNYKNESPTTTHIGPVAQDFFAAFGLGGSDTSISTIDPAGVALVGVQALSTRVQTIESLLASSTPRGGDSTAEVLEFLQQFSVTLTKGIAHFASIVTDSIATRSITVDEGIQIKDKNTGEYYCVAIASGEWAKTKGDCGDSQSELVSPDAAPASADGASSTESTATSSTQALPTDATPLFKTTDPDVTVTVPARSETATAPESSE